MTKMIEYLPMRHTVALVVYPGFELLDASGPASVFDAANHALRKMGKQPFYTVETLSPAGGAVLSSSGIALHTRALADRRRARIDTLLITGATVEHLMPATADPLLKRWVPRYARSAARFGSICSGAFILAALGLLDGKRVATHWDACPHLARRYPSLSVDANSVYVTDGKAWTSAGVSTGIDMALAMVGRDLGASLAGDVARWLVLYAHRPGYQSQFSPLLRAQTMADNPFVELIGWLQANLDRRTDVARLAARVSMTERSFHRKFVTATGETPARFVEMLRLDAARMLLSKGISVKAIAAQVGLSPARLTSAFERRFGLTPRVFRAMHGGR